MVIYGLELGKKHNVDRPSIVLGRSAKADVFKVMRDLAQAGMGILFVTSDLEEVMALSDRILVMSNGRLTGLPSSRFNKPHLMKSAGYPPDLRV